MSKRVDKEKADKSSNDDTEETIKEGTEEANNNAIFDNIDDRLDELMVIIGGSKSDTVIIQDYEVESSPSPQFDETVTDSPVFNYMNNLSSFYEVESSPSPQFDETVTDSPVFNYMNNLSPLRTVKYILNLNPFSDLPLPLPLPLPVFTTPHYTSLHKESKMFKIIYSSNEQVSAQAIKYGDGSGTTPDNPFASLCGRGENSGVEQQKWYDYNVKRKNETPDWESLISDISDSELLIYGPPNDSEAFRCHMMQRESTSEVRRFNTVIGMPTMQPHSNDEPESSHAIPSEDDSFLHRSIKRRCLDSGMPGNKQTLSENNTAACESSTRRVVPSIGLHQNAIVMSSKNSKTNVTHDNSSSGKKKRDKLESGEGESCKACTCKKSKCLKLYCDCFAAGVHCRDSCSCVDCFNKPIHNDIVEATRKQIKSRNTLAFAPKDIRSSDSVLGTGDDASKTPASAPQKRVCSCRKSNCLKKYCICYQDGVGCSRSCRCESCENAYGRKDSSVLPMGISRQQMFRQPFSSSKNKMPSPLPYFRYGSSSEVFNRQNVRKPDISLTHSVTMEASTPPLLYQYTRKVKDKKVEITAEDPKTVAEDGAEKRPTILIKSVSPNGKRVSPPHLDSSSSGSVNLREK